MERDFELILEGEKTPQSSFPINKCFRDKLPSLGCTSITNLSFYYHIKVLHHQVFKHVFTGFIFSNSPSGFLKSSLLYHFQCTNSDIVCQPDSAVERRIFSKLIEINLESLSTWLSMRHQGCYVILISSLFLSDIMVATYLWLSSCFFHAVLLTS